MRYFATFVALKKVTQTIYFYGKQNSLHGTCRRGA